MTVPIQDPIVSYTGNGIATLYTVPFRILLDEDLVVLVGSAVSTAYSVSGLGDDEATVTFTAAPADGAPILMYRDVALERQNDYQFNGDLRAATVNADFDRLWMAMQDTAGTANRSLHFPITEFGLVSELPPAAERATKVLVFDASGNADVSAEAYLEPSAVIDQAIEAAEELIGGITIPTFQSFIPAVLRDGVDYTSGTSTSVTLPATDYPKAISGVFFDGGFQSASQWTLGEDDVTVTFLGAIPAGIGEVNVMYFSPALLGMFMQFGAGIVPRTFQSKMRDIISARDFGARGDTVVNGSGVFVSGHDDTASINAAITHAGTIGGGTVVLENGFFCVTMANLNADNVGIECRNAKIFYKATDSSHHCINISAKKNSVSGCVIQGDPTLSRGDSGFAICSQNASQVHISKNRISSIPNAGIYVTATVVVHVTQNTVDSTKADGIHFSDGTQRYVCTENIVSNTADDAIATVLDTLGAQGPQVGVIANNTVKGTVAGHGITYIGCAGLVIANNTITDTAYGGIGNYMWNDPTFASAVLITGNNIINPGRAPANALNVCGILVGQSADTKILGNTIEGIPANGSYAGAAILLTSYQKVWIKGNVLKDGADHGIYLLDSTGAAAPGLTDLYIEDNSIANFARQAIRVNPTDTFISGLFVTGNRMKDCTYGSGETTVVSLGRTQATPMRYFGNMLLNFDTKLVNLDPTNASDIKEANNIPAF